MLLPLLIMSSGTLGVTPYQYAGGELMRYDGGSTLERVSTAVNGQNFIHSLTEFNGRIYGGTADAGNLLEYYVPSNVVSLARFTDGTITDVANQVGNSDIYALGLCNEMITGTGGGALLQLPIPRHYAPSLASAPSNPGLAPTPLCVAFDNEFEIRSLTGYGANLMASTAMGGNLLRADIVMNIVSVGVYSGGATVGAYNYVVGFMTELHTLTRFSQRLFSGASPGGVLVRDTGNLGAVSSLRSYVDTGSVTVNVNTEIEDQYEIHSLTPFNTRLFSGTGTGGRLFQTSQTFTPPMSLGGFTDLAVQSLATENANQSQICSVVGYNGFMFGSTAMSGTLQRNGTVAEAVWNCMQPGIDGWEPVASEHNDRQSIFRLLPITATLYASAAANAAFYSLAGNAWVSAGPYPGAITYWLTACVHDAAVVFGGIGDAFPWEHAGSWANLTPNDSSGYTSCCALVSLDLDQDATYELYGLLGSYTAGSGTAPSGVLAVVDTATGEWDVLSGGAYVAIVDAEGRLFAVTTSGALVEYVVGTGIVTRASASAGAGSPIWAVYDAGQVWVVTNSGRLLSAGLDGDVLTVFDVRALVPNEDFQSLAVHDGTVWVGSMYGALYWWTGAGLTVAEVPWSEGPALRTMASFGGALMVGFTRPGGFV